ncbi:MAG: vWA domain-containing protein, partial [Pseudomonadales bacterium]
MKSKIIAVAIFGLTVATVLFFPSLKSKVISGQTGAPPITPITLNDAPKVEVVFVLDTTGSMSGLIQAAKEKIWSIATTMASAQPAPEIRMGLVAYRDRGDAYVTRVVDLSSDLDSMYATLMDFQADGGGDTPESVNQALHDAVHSMSWSGNDDSYKVVFLVGDAPPHMDYQDDVKYMQTLAAAEDRGIVVNTVQCGEIGATVAPWQQIAALGHGRYFQVEQAGSALAMTTPYDAALARLSAELDATRIFYGDAEEKEKMKLKADATDKLH